jgi:hypothetical protein
MDGAALTVVFFVAILNIQIKILFWKSNKKYEQKLNVDKKKTMKTNFTFSISTKKQKWMHVHLILINQ